MNIAEEVARWAKDPQTKVGAVIVSQTGEILATGFNGLARGVKDDPNVVGTRYYRPEKYFWSVHAELNAILNAARTGVVTFGTIMYSQQTPCHGCASAIVQAGIIELVLPGPFFVYSWDDPGGESAARANTILIEGGVDIRGVEHDGE
jgi:dCMP deaminase